MTEPEKKDPALELDAMKLVLAALSGLDQAQEKRVLQWAGEVLGHKEARPETRPSEALGAGTTQTFDSLAELHAATSPETDVDRALVAGYWFQYVEGVADFNSQQINTALKDLGHGINNITGALDSLKNRKPALVIQLKKAGTTRQARKTYKLTAAGKQAVEAMVGSHQNHA